MGSVPTTTAKPRGFRRLIAWQKADALASAVYRAVVSSSAPQWLASQAMRAAVSVPANIAEGYGRGSVGDYLRFLDIARGSLGEVEYYIHFLRSNDVIGPEQCDQMEELAVDTGNLLVGLMRALRVKQKDGTWNRLAEEMPEYHVYDANLPSSSSFHLPRGEV